MPKINLDELPDIEIDYEEIFTASVQGKDGIEYLIPLPGWYWMALKLLQAQTVWTPQMFVRMAWDHAKEMENDGTMTNPGNFPLEFTRALQAMIHVVINEEANEAEGHVNDNPFPLTKEERARSRHRSE